MKDAIKLLLLILPAIKDLLGIVKKETRIARKRRIVRILENQDLSKIEKLERILLRVGLEHVDVLGFVNDGKIICRNADKPLQRGVIVTEGFVHAYYRLGAKLNRRGKQ
jgi:hypothetical protein